MKCVFSGVCRTFRTHFKVKRFWLRPYKQNNINFLFMLFSDILEKTGIKWIMGGDGHQIIL